MSDFSQLDYSLSNPNGSLEVEIMNTIKQSLGIPITHPLLGVLPPSDVGINQELRKYLQETLRPAAERRIEHDDVDTIMSVKEAGLFLELAVQTIYGMTSRREIPFFKKGKRLYFKKSELLTWIEEGKKSRKSEIAKKAENYIVQNKRKIKNSH